MLSGATKRTVDLVLSSLGLVIAFPLMAAIAIAILLDSRGGVFYRGVRIGRHGKPFRIYKFRSMVENAERGGPVNISHADPRVTRLGKFLRKSKLDEVPQLINVFLGDMSFVGPRPELSMYVDMYTEEEKEILEMKPGVTDWASLVHFDQYVDFTLSEDSDRTYLEEIRPLKLKLQLLYARNHSFWIDVRVLCWTVLKLIVRNEWLPADVMPLVQQQRNHLLALRQSNAQRGDSDSSFSSPSQ